MVWNARDSNVSYQPERNYDRMRFYSPKINIFPITFISKNEKKNDKMGACLSCLMLLPYMNIFCFWKKNLDRIFASLHSNGLCSTMQWTMDRWVNSEHWTQYTRCAIAYQNELIISVNASCEQYWFIEPDNRVWLFIFLAFPTTLPLTFSLPRCLCVHISPVFSSEHFNCTHSNQSDCYAFFPIDH